MGILDDYKKDVEQSKQSSATNSMTENMENIQGYKPYEQMNEAERAQVDKKVNEYYEDTDVDGIMNFMSHLDTGRMAKVNESMTRMEQSKNKTINEMRLTLLQDRIKNRFYPGLDKELVKNQSSEEISQLKDEISDLKKEMSDMMTLLKDKLT